MRLGLTRFYGAIVVEVATGGVAGAVGGTAVVGTGVVDGFTTVVVVDVVVV